MAAEEIIRDIKGSVKRLRDCNEVDTVLGKLGRVEDRNSRFMDWLEGGSYVEDGKFEG